MPAAQTHEHNLIISIETQTFMSSLGHESLINSSTDHQLHEKYLHEKQTV